jgi:hypothetical protein
VDLNDIQRRSAEGIPAPVKGFVDLIAEPGTPQGFMVRVFRHHDLGGNDTPCAISQSPAQKAFARSVGGRCIKEVDPGIGGVAEYPEAFGFLRPAKITWFFDAVIQTEGYRAY